MSKKNSVLFFIDSLGGGGAERVVTLLGNKLTAQGYCVDVVMMNTRDLAYELSDKVNIIYADNLPVNSLYGKMVRRVYSLYSKLRQGIYKRIMIKLGRYDSKPKSNETAFYFYAKYAIPYRELLKKKQHCVAFGFLVRSNICLLQAASCLKNVKIVFCERNNPIRPDLPPNIVKLRDKLYHRADVGVFQTDDELKYYTKLCGKKYVIPNPVKSDLPAAQCSERRHEIVNYCRLTEQKNLKLLIDAFARLRNEYDDYTLKIYGKGDYEDELRGYVKTNKLGDSVSIEGFAPDVHDRIKDAAMFVSTSDFEGLSNSMLEAMAIGLPCVCTDCDGGGARMMIKDHENGLLVPKGDVQAVYRAMKEIIENPDLAKKLSTNARKVRDELSVDKIVQQWIKVIGD